MILGSATVLVIIVAGLIVGGEFGSFVSQSIRALPFVPLAVLSYYGLHYRWARVATVLWLAALVLAIAVMATGSALGALDPAVLESGIEIAPGDQAKIALTALGMLAAAAVGLLGFMRPVRRLAARVLPLDPDSFVHTIALVTVVTLTLESFVPLVVMGEPTLIAVISGMLDGGADLDMGDGGATLRGELYGLVWIVVGAVFAVGLGVRRNLKQALTRLGLVAPTASQVGLGAALGLGLVVAVAVLGVAIDWLWGEMGWTISGGAGFDEAFGTLLAPFLTPIGAVVLGLSAGLGEEVAVRGVLQPRLGILLSNLLFTALHAFQYNWDALLVVFLLGVVLGIIRRRTNTTTSVVVHGVYDFTLVVAMMTQIPLVGE
ncbi:MAG: CPBP family intramembrane metalloprotease [Anaerolineae bacterium]|nr:CPBP family intramembrane metalloprotease [Anaerolineae bacterium]